jgi:NADPH:quinone reductase
VYIPQGLYKDREGLPQPPYTPGLEVAGTIRALGDGVNGFRVGEPVVTLSGGGSQGYASINLADALLTISLDGSKVDPALAVSALPNAATAHLALTRVAHLEPGESVLIHGALGGLASASPGIAHQLGAARVVGTVLARDFEAASGSSLPFDEIVVAQQFPAEVSAQRFDVVVDPVGGALRTASLKMPCHSSVVCWPSEMRVAIGNTVLARTRFGSATSRFLASRLGFICLRTRHRGVRPERLLSKPSRTG